MITRYRTRTDTNPTYRDVDLLGLVGLWLQEPASGPKDTLPAWSPAEYPPGAARAARNVSRVHFLVADLDGASDAEVSRLDVALRGRRWAWHTTSSHGTKPGSCLRVVAAMPRPVQAHEWPDAWARWHALVGGDPACKDPSRIYYWPTRGASVGFSWRSP